MAIFTKPLGLMLWILISVALVAGCSDNDGTVNTPDNEDPAAQSIDLDDPYGGFLAVNEMPAFGDEGLENSASDEETLDDGYDGLTESDRARAENVERSQQRVWYSVTILWGLLSGPDDNLDNTNERDPVVWDGSLALNEGVIRVLSKVRFEPEDDHFVQPRPSPQEIAWESVTHGGVDGIRVLLMFGGGPDQVSVDDTLRFEAAPIGVIEYPVAELVDLQAIHDVPGSDEQVSFTAFEADLEPDVHGFCTGAWGWVEGEDVGHFRGLWLAAGGRLLGYMQGHYGLNSTGDEVFFGKYIDTSGEFKGLLRGHYEIEEQGGGDIGISNRPGEFGRFWGEWVDGRGNALGTLHGHWRGRTSGAGIFNGSWRGYAIVP